MSSLVPSVLPAQTDERNILEGYHQWNHKLPDGVVASIIVTIEPEHKLRQLIEMGEKLQLAYSVGRSSCDQQRVIKQEVIDLTYESEPEERSAEAHISQPLPGPSQINATTNFGQPSLFTTLPFLRNKQFYYDGNSSFGNSFPTTDGVNPYNLMQGFRPPTTMGAAADHSSFPSTKSSNGRFNVCTSVASSLASNFDHESPYSAGVWNLEESEDEENERMRIAEDGHDVRMRRKSRKRIRGHCENGIFREIGCRSSLGQRYVLQHVRLHCKRMPHVPPKEMAERCFPSIAWTWLS